MLRSRMVIWVSITVTAVLWHVLPSNVDTANSGLVGPDSCVTSSAGGCYLVCPQGDSYGLPAVGATISITVKSIAGTPIPGILATDFWLVGCTGGLVLCAGSGSIDADGPTDFAGFTTISGSLASGGCDAEGVKVVVQGVIIGNCLPIPAISPDINGDLVVDVIDLSMFAIGYPSPPTTYNACLDYNCSGGIGIVDFSIFAQHYLHSC